MARLESMYVDGVGTILVDEDVLNLHPREEGIWYDIHGFLRLTLQGVDRHIALSRKLQSGRMQLRKYGVPNFYLYVTITAENEDGDVFFEDVLWFHVIHSSIRGGDLRRLVIVRDEPPASRKEEFEDNDNWGS